MRKIVLEPETEAPNFIGAWQLEDDVLCGKLVRYFEENGGKQRDGVTIGGINKSVKDTTNVAISPREVRLEGNQLFRDYFKLLAGCYQHYVDAWPFLNIFSDMVEIGEFNIARYRPGQHFQGLHCERSSINTLQRVFVWMTYLNDVDADAGGRTSFDHYGIQVRPQTGVTLIWPAEWTHAHRGEVLSSGIKYIMTGWMHFTTPGE